MLFVPHLGGRACPGDSTMRGAWLGLTWTHGPAELYRALLESTALEERLALDAIERLSPGVIWREVRLYGGAGANQLLNNLKADALGVPVRRIQRDTVPLGAALLGAQGAGIVSDLEAEVARLGAGLQSDVTLPDMTHHAVYRALADRYERTLKALSPIFNDLAQPVEGAWNQ